MPRRPKPMRAGRPAITNGASELTGYRVTPILDARAEAALGVLQHLWQCSIGMTVRRVLSERAALEAPTRLESAVAEVAARRHALAGKRRA
jgi:hypothetical protein